MNLAASSSLSMELKVHLTAVCVMMIIDGVTTLYEKTSKSAQLRRYLVSSMVNWRDSSGLAMTEQCSLLLVTLTNPTGEMTQNAMW